MPQYSGYAGGPATGDNSALPSASLWHQVDADASRPGLWFGEFQDFYNWPASEAAVPTTEDPLRGYFAFTSVGGFVTQLDAEGGQIKIGSDGDDEGAAIRAGSYPYRIKVDDGELVYEARIKFSVLTTDLFDFFCGLYEDTAFSAIVPITATQARMADDNLVGFLRDSTTTATSATLNTIHKADGNPSATTHTTIKAAAIDLVADTWIKVGMIFNRRGDNRLEFTRNGIILPDSKIIPSTQTDFPSDTRLGWAFGVTNTAATTDFPSIDWVRVAQRRVTSPL